MEAAASCGVCGHAHEQNKSTAFTFAVQGFDCFAQNQGGILDPSALGRANPGLWIFTKILRGRIFPHMEKELPDDTISRHLVAFVGDGPMGVARWRPVLEQSGSQVAIIEQFGVAEAKRGHGYGKKFLRAVIEDIEALSTQQAAHPLVLVAYVPQTDSFTAMKLFQSMGFQPESQVLEVEESTFVRMRMAWGHGCQRAA
ncbi:hypothetical protein JM18_004043 [Phytophthora kernoviae]|uniref:N-acetyltransferase domain-containing protein n=2 Tax=Phytophthora kernoviae TaxID=325452 RepID=A0A8T0LXP3_9STRA|nr:hypothetical protein G195_006663 [Phytophthora kernoviae 00238/432]KAG2522708.1 hypothetical protein JM16_005715 [Phytophthora kernoviae]KAG2524375.1 hypothetical protein JM18_004043 [Phytophthora kernoviae]